MGIAHVRLAVCLDIEMIINNNLTYGVGAFPHIYPPNTPMEDLPRLSGANLAKQLGGRYLLRYGPADKLGQIISGSQDRQFVTPTLYPIEGAEMWLALPSPELERHFALLLDPAKLDEVRGPKFVRLGHGVEYILAAGFTENAVVSIASDPPPDSSTPATTTKWPVRIG